MLASKCRKGLQIELSKLKKASPMFVKGSTRIMILVSLGMR